MSFNKLSWLLLSSLVWLIVDGDEFSPWVEASDGFNEHSTGLLQVGTTHVCTESWGEFGHGALTSTQFIHTEAVPRDFHNFSESGSPTSGLFVFANQHFALCVITKVASTQWGDILMKMAEHNMSASGKRNFEEIGGDLKGTPDEKRIVFSDPRATRAVFVRDPIARFASAFLMLCESIPAISHPEECPMRTDLREDITMKSAVEWASKTDLLFANDHYKPQSSSCELKNRIEEYNIIGLYSKEHFAEDAACVLESAGLSQFNAYWETEITDSRNHFSTSTDAEETALLQRLFTQEGANSLFTIYQEDYALFNLPRPEWIDGAIGDLYDIKMKEVQTALQ